MPDKSSTAVDYTKRGFAVFPVHGIESGACDCGLTDCPSPGKHPIASAAPRGLKDATHDAHEAEAWFHIHPYAGIGIVAGKESGIWVLDVEAEGVGELSVWEAQHGRLPETLTARTGGGGLHYLFTLPEGREIRNRVRLLGTHIDARGDGGYIVAPPSDHISGGTYSWVDPTVPVADAPEWLLDIVCPGPKEAPQLPVPVARDPGNYASAALAKACANIASAPDGARNNTLNREAYSLAGLIGQGITETDILTDLRAAGMAAGLNTREIEKTLRSGIAAGKQNPRTVPERTPWRTETEAHTSGAKQPAHVLPEIVTNERQGRLVIRDAWDSVLALNNPPSLFVKGGQLAQVRQSERGAAIEMMAPVHVQSWLLRSATWKKAVKKKSEDPTDSRGNLVHIQEPPKYVSQDMCAMPIQGLPVLESVAYSPVFDKHGQILSSPGYHGTERLWLELPDDGRWTGEHYAVAHSKEVIDDWLCDFPFATPADKAHAVGLFLLPFVRPMIEGPTPMHLVEAPQPGSGKSLLGSILCEAATGRPAPKTPLDAMEPERRKVITTRIMSGDPVVFFDNVKGRIDSPSLEAATTSAVWSDRILGKSEEVRADIRCVWIITSNNARMSADMVRRCVRIRIEPKCADPSSRDDFVHPSIEKWTEENRSRLQAAAISLILEWIDAGRPVCDAKLGSFESYAEVVGGIVTFGGWDGFLQGRESWKKELDPETAEWNEFMALWWERHRSEWVSPSEAAKLAADNDFFVNDIQNANRFDAQRMGDMLKPRRGQAFGPGQLEFGRSGRNSRYRLAPI